MKNLNVLLEDDFHRRLKVACAQQGKDISAVVRQLLEEYVEKHERKQTKK
jgi:plasmid stability protein